MKVNVFFTVQDEWKRAINGIDAPIDMRPVIGLRGRTISVLKSAQHLYYALVKPIYYVALAVIATISVVILLHEKRNRQAKEDGLIVLNLLGRAFVTPVSELILAIRAAAAFLYPKAYYTLSNFTLLRKEANRLLSPVDFQIFSNFLEDVRNRKNNCLDNIRASKKFYTKLDQELDLIAIAFAAKGSTGQLTVNDNKRQRALQRVTDAVKNNPYSLALVLSACQRQRLSLRAIPGVADRRRLAALDNLYGAGRLDTTTSILKREAARLYTTNSSQSQALRISYRSTLQDFNSFIDRINNKQTPYYSGSALETITQKMKQDLKDIATEFIALYPDKTPKIDDDKKKEVISELAKASKNCGPRWAEECVRQKMAIHEPTHAEELMPYFFLRMKNDVIYDIITNELDQHTNDANTIRCAIGAEIRVDDSLAQLDTIARTAANAARHRSHIEACTEYEKNEYLKHFFKRYTPERILTQLTAWLNPEKREDLRGKLQGLLRDNYEKRYKDQDGSEYIMKNYLAQDEFGQITGLLFNEAGIIALCEDEMSYAAAKILDLKLRYGENFFDDSIPANEVHRNY